MVPRTARDGLGVCDHGDTVPVLVTIPAGLSHTGQERQTFKEVDRCIASIIRGLNAFGVRTVSSCCGHGKNLGWILLEDGRELLVAPDTTAARAIARGYRGGDYAD